MGKYIRNIVHKYNRFYSAEWKGLSINLREVPIGA